MLLCVVYANILLYIYIYLISKRFFNKVKFAEATIMYEQHIFGIYLNLYTDILQVLKKLI